jgi:hypothetical protein
VHRSGKRSTDEIGDTQILQRIDHFQRDRDRFIQEIAPIA